MITRFVDILLGIILLIFFLPFMIIISVVIKLDDWKATVFVEDHWRVGRNGSLFLMYKFRTMVPNAHELIKSDPKFAELKKMKERNNEKLKIEDDIRITRVGRIIRRFDLDELPQILNVLKGDMSLVGPRAYFREEIDSYSKKYDIFNKRVKDVLKLKPGITGLWQISGRNLHPVKKRIEYDYEYFKKKNVLFDLLILLKTPWIVITRYGALD